MDIIGSHKLLFQAPLEILFLALLLSSKLDFDSPENFLIHPGLIYQQYVGQEAFLTSFSGRIRVNGRPGSAILDSPPTRARLLCGLLLLCGDISLNPGPAWKYPCGLCKKPVKSNQRGLQCDSCNIWNHAKCMDISIPSYESLANSSCLWLCPKCDASNFSETLLSASTLELSNSFIFLPSQTSSPVAKTTPRNSSTSSVLEHARKSSRPRHKQGLKVFNINFQSLKNKNCEFQAFLATESPDIVIGTETWLNPSVKTCEFFPSNYSVFRKDRPNGYGGVLLAVKDLSCHELYELNSDCETVWIKVSINRRKHVYIGAFYNPDSSCEALDELDRSLSKLQRKSGNSVIYLGGDFNLGGDICWETNTIARGSRHVTACEKLLEMCSIYSLEQVVDKPTRGDKILDLLFTTNSTLVDSVHVKPAMGDHGCVEIQTLVTPKLARPIRRKIFLYSKGNFVDMKRDLLEFSSVYFTNFTVRSLQENWNMLKGKLSSLMEEYIPAKMSSNLLVKPRVELMLLQSFKM
ncbi:uncharacterized protein LOC125557331 [Nematostella vectensis]|uniref:uncharacterized protein LOC125557331 n=1 Tax=Nematostella vectensis TaxID=45351 RepID=UPI00207708D0|nr:uncharacterized protein LOC125557331 [Nematostella vectensis]